MWEVEPAVLCYYNGLYAGQVMGQIVMVIGSVCVVSLHHFPYPLLSLHINPSCLVAGVVYVPH